MPTDKIRVCTSKHLFCYFSTKTYVVGAQKNHLTETVLFEYPKHMFKQMDKKIIEFSALKAHLSRPMAEGGWVVY